MAAITASAIPGIPHAFYGEVTIGGDPAPDGTTVEAKIGGVAYETTTTVSGRYGHDPTFKVPADDTDTGEVEGGIDGDTVMFYVAGVWAANHTFQSGEITELDLSIEALPTPEPSPPPSPPPKDTTPPTISNPSPTGDINTTTPTISANYTDNRKIDTDSVRLVLDGVDVTEGATVTSSWVTYVPEPLANGTTHLVGLTVADPKGNEATLEWNFTVMLAPSPPPPPPLPPILSDLTITPAEIELGDEVTISFIITNINEQSFTCVFDVLIGDLTMLFTVELKDSESKTVSYTITPNIVGVCDVEIDGLTGSFEVKEPTPPPPPPPKPAEFLVSDLVVNPHEVEPGENVVISAKITNIGEEYGSHTVELKLDGAVVDSMIVDLNGGDSAIIGFAGSSEEEGIHTVEVDGSSDSFTVKAPPPPKKPIWPWIALVAVIAAILLYIIWKRTKVKS